MAGPNATGVVVSAGKMMKTVKVRIAQQNWNNHIRKFFSKPTHYLVRDPNNSTREGDIVRIAAGFRVSKQVRHVVTAIIAPFGDTLRSRPHVPSEAKRQRQLEAKRHAKLARRAERRRLSASTPNEVNTPGWTYTPDASSGPSESKILEALEAAEAKAQAESITSPYASEGTTASGAPGAIASGARGPQEKSQVQRRRDQSLNRDADKAMRNQEDLERIS
ncbi:nucleic acid-binding protein [Xylona heveae TC161]|uniref:Nucleic acid-binding protein n=1 Tax=Xylona heveae (strain CBS 132557 / TC161) TaxID=1328760 RepID=A0A165G8M8_XYLHT|nr:nucleic acid-binding protein [Xylona heveae TC161]KZF21874.1 nucleic acid-binding protein [Xylona heveae TC161]